MRTENLTERVAFDPPDVSDDGHGGTEVGWNTTAAVEARAHFRWLRGGEVVQAARLEGRQPVVVSVLACAALREVDAAWRMRDLRSGGIFNVRSGPVPTEDRLWLEFTVEGGVAV
jgi:head-tail adaptor